MKAFRDREFWILILLAVAYCSRALFLNETFYFRDLYYHFMPSRQYLADALRAGEIPLWNPYLHGGQPFLANINNVALYPTALLYTFLPLLTAFNLEISLHLIICAGGAYLLARTLGASPLAAFVCGGIYAFCGYTLSCATFLNRIFSAAYLPLLLLAWRQFLMEGTRRWFAASILCGVLLVLAGAPETTLIGFTLILVWTMAGSWPRKQPSNFGAWVLAAALTAGVAAIQIVPTLEMSMRSVRSLGVNFEGATRWSLDPRRLPELIFAGFLGRTDAMSQNAYWGRNIEDSFPYIPSIYFGSAVLVAALAAGLSRRSHAFLQDRHRWGLFGIVLISLLLAFGKHLPGYALLYQWIPLFRGFRYPIKFLNAATLPVALLAAHAFDAYTRDGVTQMKKAFGFLSLMVVTFLLVIVVFPDAAAAVQRYFFLQTARPEVQDGIVHSLFHAGFALLFILAALFLRSSLRMPLLAGILVLDLFLAGRNINPTADRHFFSVAPPAADWVRSELSGGRLFRIASGDLPIAVKAPKDQKIWRYHWALEVLGDSSAAFYRIPLIYDSDYDGMTSIEMTALGEYAQKLPWNRKASFIDAGSASVIVTHEKLERPGVEFVKNIPNSSNMEFKIYRNHNAVPPVRFSALPVYVASDHDALAALVDPRFHPAEHVILMSTAKAAFQPDCTRAEVKTLHRTDLSSVVSVNGNCAGWIEFSEPYDPGWHIKLDGHAVPLLKANYAFSAVRVEPGQHTIHRTYRPKSVWIGATISLLSLLALLAVCRIFP